MRIATFNVENLFSRPAAMNHLDNADGQPALNDFHALNSLLKEPVFDEHIKRRIEELVDKYRLMDRRVRHDRLILREIRGELWQQHQDGTRTWEATGSDDFLGWVELVRDPIDDRAIRNTARVYQGKTSRRASRYGTHVGRKRPQYNTECHRCGRSE